MKFTTLLILALGGFVAYLLFHPVAPSAAPAAPVAAVAAPSAAPVPPAPIRRPSVPAESLVIARGTVVAVTPAGVIVDCVNADAELSRQFSGLGGGANLAQLAIDQENKKYGPLMMVRNGALAPSEFNPRRYVEGTAVLVGHPAQARLAEGAKVRVIVAPLEMPVKTNGHQLAAFTADYQMSESASAKADSWMWKKGPLDPAPRR